MENIFLLSFACSLLYNMKIGYDQYFFVCLNINNVTYNFTKVDNLTNCENEIPAVYYCCFKLK